MTDARRTLEHTAPRHDSEESPGSLSDDAASERVRVTLVFRWHRASATERHAAASALATQLPADRGYLQPDELTDRFGPSAHEREGTERRVRAFAASYGLDLVSADARCAVLVGPATAVSDALGITLAEVEVGGDRVRVHGEDLSLPADLAERVDHVLGAHTLPRSTRHATHAPTTGGAASGSAAPASAAAGAEKTDDGREHTEIDDLCRVYDFPPTSERSCDGLTIGIVSLGGGIYQDDLQRYFRHHGMEPPAITFVRQSSGEVQTEPRDGRWGEPAPLDTIQQAVDTPESAAKLSPARAGQLRWTVEVTMDVQLVGRICPGAAIVVYLADNDNQGEYWALSEALYGPFRPTIISCSWGSREPTSDQPDRIREIEILDSLLLDAGLLGRTICVASGDSGDGSAPGEKPPRPRVVYPASSEHVLACGGSMFRSATPERPEAVWNEVVMKTPVSSGGGFSQLFPQPEWQAGRIPRHGTESAEAGRGVPDVAGKADVACGFCMLVGDRDIANGGTSAAAPFWTGLLALASRRLGAPPGFVNAHLYSDAFRGALRSVDHGSNGVYDAAPGWDPCCGLGTPLWARLCEALGGDARPGTE